MSLIRNSEGRWQFDDFNQSDLPIATAALVADQQDYSLDVAHLKLTRAEVKDQAGNWVKLTPLDQTDVYDQSLTDFMKTSGTPVYYDTIGNSVFLYPKPSYSQSASLKLFYERGPSYFTSSDTTKTPGFVSIFHQLIPLWTGYDFAMIKGLAVGDRIRAEIQRTEDELVTFYQLRNKEDRPALKARIYRFR